MRNKRLFSVLVLAGSLAVPAASTTAQCSALFFARGDYATIPYSNTFPVAVFTVTAWIKVGAVSRRAAIVSHGEDNVTGNSSWTLAVQTDGTFQVMVEDIQDNNFWYSSNVVVNDGSWHHVAATRSASGTMVFYVDGRQRASTQSAVPSPNNNQVMTFGCTYGIIGPPPPPPNPAWFFPGTIDEPAVWNRPLTEPEISTVFSRGADPGSAGLVGSWHLDEGSGQTLSDASPAGNHGFLGASASPDGADPQWVIHSAPRYVTYGGGCVGSAGTPTLAIAAGQLPSLGSTFDVIASSLPAFAPAFGVLGNARSSLDLTAIGMTGCMLHTNIVVAVPLTSIGGSATWSLLLPAHPGLLGLSLFQQVLIADPGVNPFGATMSNAGEAVVGCR